jgi:hypothetical protein
MTPSRPWYENIRVAIATDQCSLWIYFVVLNEIGYNVIA